MATVKNTIAAETTLGRWYPGDLAFIEEITYRCRSSGEPSVLQIVGRAQRRDTIDGAWPSNSAPQFRVRLQFRGIRDLRIREIGDTPKQVTGFDIVDISDRGWEGVAFEIEDYENGIIHFLCNEIELIEVAKA